MQGAPAKLTAAAIAQSQKRLAGVAAAALPCLEDPAAGKRPQCPCLALQHHPAVGRIKIEGDDRTRLWCHFSVPQDSYMLQYHSCGVLQGCKGILCCLDALTAGCWHSCCIAQAGDCTYVKNHDVADSLSAIAICTNLNSCCILFLLACTMGTLPFDTGFRPRDLLAVLLL